MNRPTQNNKRYSAKTDLQSYPNDLPEIDDAKLWQQFRGGSETAFIKIYNDNFDILLNYGFQLSRNQELIEDCIQDVFIYLRQKRKSLGPTDCIRFYLMKCMKRKLIDEIKSSKKPLSVNHQDGFQITFSHEDILIDQQIQQEKSEKLNKALSILPRKQREAIYYFYFQNLNYSQISELLGFDHVKSARNLVYKALSAMKSAMK
ncbi:sigma-70 family RNA polymerase sigma factor [Cyclobacterium sp. 1_MG-2023]|uniref:RNA polymerase sigma factor n=1 Tax=Cyclobacterium sp. 1_MG-2023 TaxID=3062681 RepID=UPI0026E2E196|nr:sigma-70 family RNA polymerase sigma factor [Cyclobacterium sp. 1_MG-2023]MDO6439348.1 sigma-70 family RNA polymerase sigma factor [Cyclobacterium sp. 1_MG-2023]